MPLTHTPASSPPRKGFALVVALVLMAFLLFLLLSLGTISHTSLQTENTSQKQMEAQQNARLALDIALAQLQLYAGADQRITAPADFASDAPADQLANPRKGLAQPANGARQWLGIWGNNSAADSIYTQAPAPVLLNWLVSGNATTTAPVVGNDGHIESPSAAAATRYHPYMVVNNLSAATEATASDLTIDGDGAILLVGPHTAGSDAARFVAAPLVDIESDSRLIGRYAYWIGDEGVKARYDLRDTRTLATDPATEADARYRLMTPSRNAIELVSGHGDYPQNDPLLDSILSQTQLGLASPSLSQADQQATVHDLTTVSLGVLANSQSGGLRTDLTHVLSQSSLGAEYAGKTVIPDITPASESISIAPEKGATWDTVKSFHDLATAIATGDPVPVRTATQTQMGISPVLVASRLMFDLDMSPRLHPLEGFLGVTETRVFFHVRASFTIANPYSFPITAPSGLDFSYAITTQTDSEWGISLREGNQANAPFDREAFEARDTENGINRPYFPLLLNTARGATGPSVLDDVRFRTPALTLAPGEIRTFTLAGQTNSNAGGGDVAALTDSGLNTDHYYNYDTGTSMSLVNPANKDIRFTLNQLMAEAMSLQMAIGGSPALNGSLPQPQSGALQVVINADLSTTNSDGPSGDTFYPRPRRWSILHRTTALPFTISGYGMSLSLPIDDSNFYNTRTRNNMQHHRPYMDYNLTALNLAFPPFAALQPATETGLRTAPASYANMETTPPFNRQYLKGSPYDNNPSENLTMKGGSNLDLFPRDLAGDGLRWGTTTATTGKKETVLYDAPRRDSDEEISLFSIAQLQHADLTGDDFYQSVSYQPRYAVGNSQFNIYLERDKTIAAKSRQSPVRVGNTNVTSPTARVFDLSYLLNTALWDSFFFSTLRQSGEERGTPANQRLVFAAGHSPTDAQLGIGSGQTPLADLSGNGTTLQPEKAAARYLMNKGAFNVNSTSVESWKAILSGARGIALNGDSAGTPFARSLNQPEGSTDAGGGSADSAYSGYRRLSDAEIATLAEKIVEQVRARGPFVSLAHFINREPGPDTDPRTATGALQAAIDAAAINPFTGAPDTVPVRASNVYPNTAVTDFGNRATGAPGWLTQADVLQSIGPLLTARSDTFTIRAYGEALLPSDPTVVTARAWCEAIVQRFPDYVDASQSAAAPPNATDSTRTFGRKFRIIAFRWLTPDEI